MHRSHGTPISRAAVVLAVTTVLAVASLATPVAGASSPACKVHNATRGGTHKTLQAAVSRSRAHDKLEVRGVCKGHTRIENRKLTIVGVKTRKSGTPKLRVGNHKPVLRIVGYRANVKVQNLTIQGRKDHLVKSFGGAIDFTDGRLTLNNVTIRSFWAGRSGGGVSNRDGTLKIRGKSVIRGNRAQAGGGIYNTGRLLVKGNTLIEGNCTNFSSGGGIYTDGSATLSWRSSVHDNTSKVAGGGIAGSGLIKLTDRASVSGNTARRDGGGIVTGSGTRLLLRDHSSVTGNTSIYDNGGGIYANGGRVEMSPSARVTGNTALSGAGIKAELWVTVKGAVCAPPGEGGNVYGNTPDDCVLD